MTKLTSLFLIIIFFLCLLVGIGIGVSVTPPPTPTPPPTSTPIECELLASILVLGIQDFDNEELYLESAWQVIILKTPLHEGDYIEVVMLPKYPLTPGQVTNPNHNKYLEPHDPIPFPRDYLENLYSFDLLNAIPLVNLSRGWDMKRFVEKTVGTQLTLLRESLNNQAYVGKLVCNKLR